MQKKRQIIYAECIVIMLSPNLKRIVFFYSFRKGNDSFQDLPRSGRPTSINLDELNQAIETGPSLSTRDVANKV